MKLFKSIQHAFSHSLASSVKTKMPFKELDDIDLEYFRTILPSNSIITDTHDLEPFNNCFRKLDRGHSQLALLPNSTEQISKILRYCNDKKIAVVPQGGNTGLVGGSVPVFDQIILSTKNLNKIEKFDPLSSVVTCQAGVILDKINEYLLQYNCEVPLDLGAKGSCQVGGNASTNAGGKYVIKHGSFRSHILGLQAVLPNGQILDMTSQIHKDNTGYDLKNLFIGSEGTIGMITKLNIHCARLDHDRKILVFKSKTFDKILDSLPIVRKFLGKQLNALEYVDGITYECVKRNLGYDFMDVSLDEHLLFIQTTSDNIEELIDKLPQFEDSIMSNNDQEFSKIWKVREDVTFAALKEGKQVLSYDVSFNVAQWPKLLEDLRSYLPTSAILGFGHIGDGNLHINLCPKNNQIVHDEQIFKKVVAFKGSISAEHGVGCNKDQYLHLQKSKQILKLYKNIKNIFDPNGIMNPYKVLPVQTQ